MDTINKAAPVTGVVPLGTIRRNNRTIMIRHDADEEDGIRFKLAAVEPKTSTELGSVTLGDGNSIERRWLEAATSIGISKSHVVEGGVIRCLRSLARSIEDGTDVPGDHGFVKASDCPYGFAVGELKPWKA